MSIADTHEPAPVPNERPAVAEGPLPEVPPAATEADALIRLAYDARFGGHEWQRRAHSYLWRDPKPSPAVAEAAEEAAEAAEALAAYTSFDRDHSTVIADQCAEALRTLLAALAAAKGPK